MATTAATTAMQYQQNATITARSFNQGLNSSGDQVAQSGVSTGAQTMIGALTALPNSTNGITNNSLMYTSGQQQTQVSAMSYFTGGSITASNLGQLNGISSNSSNLAGWNVNTTSISSPNGAIVLDSQKNSLTADNGVIGGWIMGQGTLTSPNGNIVLDGNKNRIVLYELGVPTIVIQG